MYLFFNTVYSLLCWLQHASSQDSPAMREWITCITSFRPRGARESSAINLEKVDVALFVCLLVCSCSDWNHFLMEGGKKRQILNSTYWSSNNNNNNNNSYDNNDNFNNANDNDNNNSDANDNTSNLWLWLLLFRLQCVGNGFKMNAIPGRGSDWDSSISDRLIAGKTDVIYALYTLGHIHVYPKNKTKDYNENCASQDNVLFIFVVVWFSF